MKKKRPLFSSAFAKLAAEEEQFFGSDFLCPVVRGHPLRIRLSGIVMNLHITSPKTKLDYEGYGIFRAISTSTARYVREASLAERRDYLELFPLVRLILCSRNEEQWLGAAASSGDNRFQINGLVPLRLAKDLQMFETVHTRFDGKNFWLDGSDSSASLKNAAFLRDSLIGEVEPDKVLTSGLTKEEKQAYAIAFLREIENKKDKNEERIKRAMTHAGAEYRSYVERGDSFTVEYSVDGKRHQSIIKKDTLEVQSAGICLSGGDRAFDLQSLVGVIKEGENRRLIVHVGLLAPSEGGDGDHDDDDW